MFKLFKTNLILVEMTLPYTTTGLFVNDVILSSFVLDKMQYQIKKISKKGWGPWAKAL